MVKKTLILFSVLLVSSSSFSAKKKVAPNNVPAANGKMSSYGISQPKSILKLDVHQKASFESAQKDGTLLQETPLSCACNIEMHYFCLFKKKGDSLEKLKPLVEKVNSAAQAAKCPPNAGCRPGYTNLYFYCD